METGVVTHPVGEGGAQAKINRRRMGKSPSVTFPNTPRQRACGGGNEKQSFRKQESKLNTPQAPTSTRSCEQRDVTHQQERLPPGSSCGSFPRKVTRAGSSKVRGVLLPRSPARDLVCARQKPWCSPPGLRHLFTLHSSSSSRVWKPLPLSPLSSPGSDCHPLCPELQWWLPDGLPVSAPAPSNPLSTR